MKKVIQMGIPFLFTAIILISAGTKTLAGWNKSTFDNKVFIENKGQFNEQGGGLGGKVLFGTYQPAMQIFWTKEGLTYKVKEVYVTEDAKREAVREGNPEELMERAKVRYHYLGMRWVGANPNVSVQGTDAFSHYYTFENPNDPKGASGIKASGFKKILYKDVYPGIDVEYVLPDAGGVKYSFIVHPGADPSQIGIEYTGEDKMLLNGNGEVSVKSSDCGDFMEHAPVSFYTDGTPVLSAFTFVGGMIGFNLQGYDNSKTVIIDPWVSVINLPAGSAYTAFKNNGYAVCYDNAGNVWVYGGSDPLSMLKYSSGGALLWVYTVPHNATWLVGDMEVDKNSGSAYVSEGYGQFGADIVKVNPAGMQTAKLNGTTKNFEISRLRLNCSGQLYCTGGGVPQNLWQVAHVDTNLGSMTGGVHVTASANGDHDINLMTLDPSGTSLYVNYNYPAPGSIDFLHDNEMYKLPLPGLSPTAWMNAGGPTHHFQELSSMPYSGDANGAWASRINIFNGMVCGNGFLYTYNGDTLKQWDKATGAMIKMVKTGGKPYVTGGLDLDLCENVYASVGNAVKKYDLNLNFISTVALPDTSCYDLKVDRMKNILYACGNKYVCAVSLGNAVPLPALTLTVTSTPASGCSACNGTATASASLSSVACLSTTGSPVSYTWMPGGKTTPSISNLCPGTYTVIAKMVMTCLTTISDTDTVVINGAGTIQDDFVWNGNCSGLSFNDTNKTVSTWKWSFPGGTPSTSTIQNPSGISYAPGTYTATLIVSAGGGCTDTIVHIFTVGGFPTAAFQSAAPCLGSITTLADGSVSSPGDPIQSWSWSMTGGTPSSSTSQNTATQYSTGGTHTITLVITTQSGCKDTIVQQVVVYTPPVALFAGNGQGCAPVCVTNFQDSSTSTDGNITGWAWSFPGGSPASASTQIPPTVCYNTPGTYGASLIVTTTYGCSDTLSLTPLIDVHPWPHADFAMDHDKAPATDPVFAFNDLWSPNPGVTAWVWDFGDGSALDSINTDPVHNYSATVGSNDFYNYNVCLKVENQYGCWDTTCKTLDIVPEFTFYIPNTFTPNGDFLNENFFGKGRGIKDYTIRLFDRWGNMIWDCHQTGTNSALDVQGQDGLASVCQWDGKVQPGGADMSGKSRQLAQEDVYVWKVNLTDIFDREHNYVGHVSVVK